MRGGRSELESRKWDDRAAGVSVCRGERCRGGAVLPVGFRRPGGGGIAYCVGMATKAGAAERMAGNVRAVRNFGRCVRLFSAFFVSFVFSRGAGAKDGAFERRVLRPDFPPSKQKNDCDGMPMFSRMKMLSSCFVRCGSPKSDAGFPIRPAFSYLYPNLILSMAWNCMY